MDFHTRWMCCILGEQKKTCLTHSIMEYEFIVLATTGKELEWIRILLLDIKLWRSPMLLFLSIVIVRLLWQELILAIIMPSLEISV